MFFSFSCLNTAFIYYKYINFVNAINKRQHNVIVCKCPIVAIAIVVADVVAVWGCC